MLVISLSVYSKCTATVFGIKSLIITWKICNKMSGAKERRILMTQWTGEAWSQCCADHHFFKRLFEKTGCLITADGSDDANISPPRIEGLQVLNTLYKNCLVDNRWLWWCIDLIPSAHLTKSNVVIYFFKIRLQI